MKTNYSDMAKRYEQAEKKVWDKLERWQKLAITEDRKTGHNSNVFETFSKEVIKVAEAMNSIPSKSPAAKKKSKKKPLDVKTRLG